MRLGLVARGDFALAQLLASSTASENAAGPLVAVVDLPEGGRGMLRILKNPQAR